MKLPQEFSYYYDINIDRNRDESHWKFSTYKWESSGSNVDCRV